MFVISILLQCLWLAHPQTEPPVLDGYWVRATEVSLTSKSGVAVQVDMHKQEAKVVQVHDGCCFRMGDLKWTSIRAVGDKFVLQELWRYTNDCQSAGYMPTELRFISPDEIELAAESVRTKWVRLPQVFS